MYTKLSGLLRTADGVLLTSPHNMRYFSGFTGGEGAVWISQKDRIVFTDSRYIEAAEAEAKEFCVVETNNWQKELENLLKSNAETIVFEDEDITAAEYVGLKQRLLKIKLSPGSKPLKKLRMIKTEAELDKIQKAEDIGCRAFEYILGILKPGIREIDVAAELEYYMKKNGGEGTSFDTISISGARTSLPHGTPSEKKIESGDFVTLDFGCKVGGYCSDMTRTVVVGKATDEQKKLYHNVKTAQQEALSFIRAGILGKQADAVARQVISDCGMGEYFRHSLGHGVGLLVHELPNLSPASEIMLEENMVVSCEPGIYIPGYGGVRIEDIVCVTKSGIKNLTYCTKELIEI